MQWLIQNWIPLAVGITFLILIGVASESGK